MTTNIILKWRPKRRFVVSSIDFFVIMWTQGATSLYERIELDLTICLDVVSNITLFYKLFVLRWLLGYRDIFKCPKYSKVIFNLEEDEISDSKKEDSTCCDSCSTWWHLLCADLTMHPADELDCWVCESWMADAANFSDTDDDFEFNFPRPISQLIH